MYIICIIIEMITDIRQISQPPSPSSSSSKSSSCFPSFAKVNIENGKVITMSDLQLGDRVETGMGICQPIFVLPEVFGKESKQKLDLHKWLCSHSFSMMSTYQNLVCCSTLGKGNKTKSLAFRVPPDPQIWRSQYITMNYQFFKKKITLLCFV